MNIASRRTGEALHLLIDSTGINVEEEGEWHARKHGVSSRRVWRKMHPAIDERKLDGCAVEVISGNIGCASMLDQIPTDREIGSAPTDSALKCTSAMVVIAGRGAKTLETQRWRRSAQRYPTRARIGTEARFISIEDQSDRARWTLNIPS